MRWLGALALAFALSCGARAAPAAGVRVDVDLSRHIIHLGGGPEFIAAPPSPRLIALPSGRALELVP